MNPNFSGNVQAQNIAVDGAIRANRIGNFYTQIGNRAGAAYTRWSTDSLSTCNQGDIMIACIVDTDNMAPEAINAAAAS